MAKVYKAVLVKLRQEKEKDNETLRSVLTPDPYEVEYQLGKTQTPSVPGSFLYAFADPQVAKAYITDSSRDTIMSPYAVLRVYSAEADVAREHPETFYTLNDIERFWAERWWEYEAYWPYVLPCIPGTVWCHSIKLKELEWTDGRTLKAPRKPERKSTSSGKPAYQRQTYRY